MSNLPVNIKKTKSKDAPKEIIDEFERLDKVVEERDQEGLPEDLFKDT